MYKFRAWDKENKVMEEIDGCNLYLADGKVYEVYEGTFAYESYMDKTNVSDRYIPMMYTGLKDKNEEEIYEGDIVRNKAGITAKIIWLDYSFVMEYKEGHNYPLGQEVEVIGNIYTYKER